MTAKTDASQTADTAPQSAREQECEASLATIVAAHHRTLTFEECDALRMRIERLYAELADLQAAVLVTRTVSHGAWTEVTP